jgi:hypothetical protein
MGREIWMMRFVGIGLLVFGLVLSGGTAADARRYHSHSDSESKPCERNGVSYPVGDYCNTSCAPNAACEVLVCFSGDVTGGAWADIGACKVRDCRKVCL